MFAFSTPRSPHSQRPWYMDASERTPLLQNTSGAGVMVGASQDTFVPSVVSVKTTPSVPPLRYGCAYRFKQWASNASIAVGVTFIVLMVVLPEPVITKAIALTVGLVLVAVGLVSKHVLYKNAFQHEALETAIAKLQQQLATLHTDIAGLEHVRDGLEKEVAALRKEIDRLQTVVTDLKQRIDRAFEQLNKEREENNAIRKRLLQRMEQADKNVQDSEKAAQKLQEEQERLKARERDLQTREATLLQDREILARKQQEFLDLQQQFLRQVAAVRK
jgi:hypothetical protein